MWSQEEMQATKRRVEIKQNWFLVSKSFSLCLFSLFSEIAFGICNKTLSEATPRSWNLTERMGGLGII